ncbi:MAG: DUF86 domain-containing protein [Lentisphaeria bacterium]|nr:DUF86 domain-containing protein [Lentisphaeria bacterium]MDY0175533.1 DUF86 domain-containing protein [Lentisphaeria bacterium]NLZ60026.1 DUF86 domain-containing protein [Lentisphaerota bacterium]
MKKQADAFFLLHVVDALTDIFLYTDVEKNIFMAEKMRQDAVQRKFSIIGEAVKNLSVGLREKYPHIQWSNMARFRDVLAHHYFGVDLDAVWQISKKEALVAYQQLILLDEYLLARQQANSG